MRTPASLAAPVGASTTSTPAALALGVVLAGTAVLVARSFASFGEDERIGWYVASYIAIAAAAILAPTPAPERRAETPRAVAVTAVGVAALAIAAVVAGPPVPAPTMPIAAPVSVLAAVAEEALYRRLAYGWLERWGAAIAIGATAVLFALVHLPAYGVTAFPVDLGAGVLFGWQRWVSGTWLAPAGTHAFANILAGLR